MPSKFASVKSLDCVQGHSRHKFVRIGRLHGDQLSVQITGFMQRLEDGDHIWRTRPERVQHSCQIRNSVRGLRNGDSVSSPWCVWVRWRICANAIGLRSRVDPQQKSGYVARR